MDHNIGKYLKVQDGDFYSVQLVFEKMWLKSTKFRQIILHNYALFYVRKNKQNLQGTRGRKNCLMKVHQG
jgi:hypothetical protein